MTRRSPLLPLLLLSALCSTARAAPRVVRDEGPRNNLVHVEVGGQVSVAKYKTGFKLAGGYARHLWSIVWLDFGSGVIVHKETNWLLDGGLRLRFARSKSGVAGFVRLQAELGMFFSKDINRVGIGGRVGGGMSYSTSPSFAASLESGVTLMPAFSRDGVALASALDFLVGFQFPL